MFGQRSINRILLAALFLAAPLSAQAPMAESQVKAMFVYNFLKFVEWPSEPPAGSRDPFVVLIVGEGATADSTQRFLETRAIGDRPLTVRRIRWDQSMAGGRAVFILERDPKKLRRILAAAAAARILTIGEGDEFTTVGGVIGLLVVDRKVRFDVDTSAAQLAGLRISSKLLALTHSVRSNGDRPAPQQ